MSIDQRLFDRFGSDVWYMDEDVKQAIKEDMMEKDAARDDLLFDAMEAEEFSLWDRADLTEEEIEALQGPDPEPHSGAEGCTCCGRALDTFEDSRNMRECLCRRLCECCL